MPDDSATKRLELARNAKQRQFDRDWIGNLKLLQCVEPLTSFLADQVPAGESLADHATCQHHRYVCSIHAPDVVLPDEFADVAGQVPTVNTPTCVSTTNKIHAWAGADS